MENRFQKALWTHRQVGDACDEAHLRSHKGLRVCHLRILQQMPGCNHKYI